MTGGNDINNDRNQFSLIFHIPISIFFESTSGLYNPYSHIESYTKCNNYLQNIRQFESEAMFCLFLLNQRQTVAIGNGNWIVAIKPLKQQIKTAQKYPRMFTLNLSIGILYKVYKYRHARAGGLGGCSPRTFLPLCYVEVVCF